MSVLEVRGLTLSFPSTLINPGEKMGVAAPFYPPQRCDTRTWLLARLIFPPSFLLLRAITITVNELAWSAPDNSDQGVSLRQGLDLWLPHPPRVSIAQSVRVELYNPQGCPDTIMGMFACLMEPDPKERRREIYGEDY